VSCAGHTIAIAPSDMPRTISGRGATTLRKRMFTDVAVTTIAAVSGRNPSPAWIGVKPFVCCR
jgi:hypothetical protein